MGAWNDVADLANNQVVTESWVDSVKAAVDMAGRYRKRARVCRTNGVLGNTDGAISSAVKLVLPTVLADNDSMAQNGALTIQTAGVWLVTASAEWTANTGRGYRTIVLYESTAGGIADVNQAWGDPGISTWTRALWVGQANVGDVFEVRLAQSSGLTLNFGASYFSLTMSAVLISG